jgi:hypothetical protein
MSAQGQADMDAMLNAALPFAQQMLAERGEFYPYAFSMSAGGEIRMVSAYTGTEKPASLDLLALIYEGLASRAVELRAAAIVSDVKLGSGDDAIRLEIEHREGAVLAVVLPYKQQRGGIKYGDLAAIPGEHRIWPPKT